MKICVTVYHESGRRSPVELESDEILRRLIGDLGGVASVAFRVPSDDYRVVEIVGGPGKGVRAQVYGPKT